MLTLVLFSHRKTHRILLFLLVHVLVPFLVSVCLLSLSVLLFYRMSNESMGEAISPSKAATRYWEEVYRKEMFGCLLLENIL